MNSIWNTNIAAFRARFPQLAQNLEQFCSLQTPDSLHSAIGREILAAKNGSPTAAENKIRLHSAYNPEREAAQAVSQPLILEKSALVFYGFGLGYQVVAWAELVGRNARNPQYSQKKLLLIEPDAAHFFSSLCVLDWTAVFQIPNLILAVGCPAEQILPLLEDTSKVNVGNTGVSDAYFFDIPAFTAHAADYFSAVRTIIERNKTKNEINAATLKKFGRLWVKNSMTNLSQMKALRPISIFEGKAAPELPFLLVAAGPTLEPLLPLLPELQSRCVLVCVETALRMLLRHNVQPDFILLTDPQYWAYKHIAGLTAPQSRLITEISTYPAVFRFSCKEILLCSSQFPVGQFFEKKFARCGDLGTGGSVASAAWNFAHFCGAKEIFTAGLDLAFPGGQTHIKGSSAEQTLHSISDRLCSVEKAIVGTLHSANIQTATDYDGKPVLTDSRMKMFAWWFESRLAACPETKTYALSRRGLSIPGITPAPLKQLLSRPSAVTKKAAFLAQRGTNAVPPQEFDRYRADFPSEEFFASAEFLRPFFG